MMESARRACVFLCFLWLGGAPGLVGQNFAPVSEIQVQHVGPPAVSDALVRANIRVKQGEPYNRNSVDDDVRNLYRTGYFYNIRVQEEAGPDGIKLTYLVQGKPTLTQILFSGNKKYSDRKLQKKISSAVGEPLDERKLFNDTQAILEQYQKSGRRQTKVKYVPVIDEKLGRGTVTFEISEAAKIKIDDVKFIGAEVFKQGKLRKAIKTRRHWMFSWLTGSGVLKDEQFEDDKDRLAEYYRQRGYIDFEIKDVQIERTKPKWMVIKFYISEGVQYRVGSVELEGQQLFSATEILTGMYTSDGRRRMRGLSMGPGEIFTPGGLTLDREGIQDYYGARGYIDAQIVPLRVPNTERGTIDLVYRIGEGEKSFIERIEIEGNTKTRDKVIRRELAVSPGEVFDMVRVKLSTNRLYGLDYFAKVDTQPASTDVPNRKDLVISVEEKSTGDVRLGAGFSSIDELVGFVEVSQGNFHLFKPPYFVGVGGGQKIRLRVQYGTARQDYVLTFVEPWFLGRKLALGTDLYYRELNFYSDLYDVRQAGGRVSLTRTLWNDFWLGSVSYTLQNIGVVNMPSPTTSVDDHGNVVVNDPVPPSIRAEEGYTLVSKLGATISYDTRNSTLLPTKGQRTSFIVQYAGGPLGGQTDFYALEMNAARYVRGILPGHIIEIVGRIGVVDNHSGDTYIHLFDRWFMGGLYSLRGYEYRSIGPYDLGGTEPIGGRTFWFGSLEYSVPIIERLRIAAFYDIGNVYPSSYSFNTLGPEYGFYTDNWGLGIRLNIPAIGPLRLDYGIPLTHDPFVGSSGRFQFGVGYTRQF